MKIEKQEIIDIIVKIYHKTIPFAMRNKVKPFLNRTVLNENPKMYREIKKNFQSGKLNKYEKECNYIIKNGLHCIPYAFIEEYAKIPVECTFDESEKKILYSS